MSHLEFLKSYTDKNCGISKVWIRHEGKDYLGIAHCHPEDQWSDFFGCGIAETRALINAAKDVLEQKRKEYKICLNFVKSVECYKDFDKTSVSALKMYRQLNRKRKEVIDAKGRVDILKNSIPVQIEGREKYLKIIEKINKKKKMDKEN